MKACFRIAEVLPIFCNYLVALLLSGSAILLNSCAEPAPAELTNEETLVSRRVDSMTIVSTENGRKVNESFTPLMENYEFAKVPFQEFRKGIDFKSFNDSTGMLSSHIVADYALHWTERDLWELKGNVVVIGENNQTLYTQQLTMDRKIKKIYSNVDTKVEDDDGSYIGEGFESNEDLTRLTFRRLTGKVRVDVEPTQPEDPGSEKDSAAVTVKAPAPAAEKTVANPAAPERSKTKEAVPRIQRSTRDGTAGKVIEHEEFKTQEKQAGQ